MNPSRPAATAPGGYYAAYGTPAPGASAAQQQQYAAPHQQHQQHHQQPQQHAAGAPGTAAAAGAPAAAYAAYAQAWQAQQQQQQNPPSAGHHQPQPQHYATQQPQQQRYAAPAPAPGSAVGGYATAAPAAVAPAAPAYAHYAHPQQQQTAAAVSYHQQYPQQQQQQQQYQQQPPQQQQQQPALTLPLLASSQQPLPAAPGQTLGAYAYPGGTGGGVAAAPAVTAAAGAGAGAGQQQQPALTPQQVAQEAIAKTMAAMQESQEQQLQPGQVLDNRRGYIHGNLIGQMEKARLERAAVKNENYVRRKDEIARRKRLGLPLDGLIDKKQLVAAAAAGGGGKGEGGGGGKANPPPRQPAGGGGGGQSRAGIGTAGAKPQNTSVYITGLPTDVSQAKIELVFSQYGAVKRTKVYRNDAGEAKGDGLVTYAKPASVDLAIAKLNGHAISVGHPISVSMADFNRTKSGVAEEPPWQQQQQEEQQQQQQQQQQQGDGQQNGAALPPQANTSGGGGGDDDAGEYGDSGLPPLPEECGADKHPVVVLRSVYTREESESDPDFFDDLEADMLMECVKFGTVISVSTPEAPGYFGCVVVTFENSGGANKCAEAMHGRWFDQRQIEALVAGKEVPDNEEKQNGPENFQQPQRQQEEHGGVANGEKKEEDMGPLLQGVPDSPPPTDLNSFLESV